MDGKSALETTRLTYFKTDHYQAKPTNNIARYTAAAAVHCSSRLNEHSLNFHDTNGMLSLSHLPRQVMLSILNIHLIRTLYCMIFNLAVM